MSKKNSDYFFTGVYGMMYWLEKSFLQNSSLEHLGMPQIEENLLYGIIGRWGSHFVNSYLWSEAICWGLCHECLGEHWSCYNVTALHLPAVNTFHIKLHGVPRGMPGNIAYFPEATLMVKTLHWHHNEWWRLKLAAQQLFAQRFIQA